MIGNDAVSDIKGAKEVGLHTFYIHSNISPDTEKKPDADHVLMQMDLAKVRQILISDYCDRKKCRYIYKGIDFHGCNKWGMSL